ncbi:type II toxin-antitoxin system PemK/MazF family toxin [Cetobacterium somerae]|uniref:type II toxin-antitoxin system PemK/MazF family toxin n=1 Tax=Cetobacterium somerae TaxID=188913 RepID=UPI003D769FA6
MPMLKGEVWLAEFPFEDDLNKSKVRPVVILDNGNLEQFKVLSVKITSKFARDEYDVPLLYWQQAKLRFPSIARTSKFMYLPKSVFKYRLGDLHDDDMKLLETKFVEFVMNSAE